MPQKIAHPPPPKNKDDISKDFPSVLSPRGPETRDSARDARPVPRDQSPEHSFQNCVVSCNGL